MADIRAGTVVFDLQANTLAARSSIDQLHTAITALEGRAAALGALAAGAGVASSGAAQQAQSRQIISTTNALDDATDDYRRDVDLLTTSLADNTREKQRSISQTGREVAGLRSTAQALRGVVNEYRTLRQLTGPSVRGAAIRDRTAIPPFLAPLFAQRIDPSGAFASTLAPPRLSQLTEAFGTRPTGFAPRFQGQTLLALPAPGQAQAGFDFNRDRAFVEGSTGARAARAVARRNAETLAAIEQARGPGRSLVLAGGAGDARAEFLRLQEEGQRRREERLRDVREARERIRAARVAAGGPPFNPTFDDPQFSDEDRRLRDSAFFEATRDNQRFDRERQQQRNREERERERTRRRFRFFGGGGRRRAGGGTGRTAFGGPLAPSVAGFGVPPGAVGGASLLAGGFIGLTAITTAARAVGFYAQAWQELQNDLGNFQTNLTRLQGSFSDVNLSLRDGLGGIINFVAGSERLRDSLGNLGASVGSLLDESSPAGQRIRDFGTRGARGAAGVIDTLGGTPDRLANTVGAVGVVGSAAVSGFTANVIARPLAVGVGVLARIIALLPGPFRVVGVALARLAEASPQLATVFGTLAPFSSDLREAFGELGAALGINVPNVVRFGEVLLTAVTSVVDFTASLVNGLRRLLPGFSAVPESTAQLVETINESAREIRELREQLSPEGVRAAEAGGVPAVQTAEPPVPGSWLSRVFQTAPGANAVLGEDNVDETTLIDNLSRLIGIQDAAQFRRNAEVLVRSANDDFVRRRQTELREQEDARRAQQEEARFRSVRGAETAAVNAGRLGDQVSRRAAALLSERDPQIFFAGRGTSFPGMFTRGGLPTEITQVYEEIAAITALQEREPSRRGPLSGRLRELQAIRDADELAFRDRATRQAALESQVDIDAFGGLDQATTDARALRDAMLELNAAALEINENIAVQGTNALLQWAQGALSAGEAFKQFTVSVLADIARIIVQQSILTAIGGGAGGTGGVGGFFAAIFNPGTAAAAGRQYGGPVSAGRSYVVGERGPEIFSPGRSGFVTPNSQLGGGTTIVNNWYSNDTTTARAAFKEFEPDLLRQARVQALQDNRRPGLQ